MIDIHCHLLYGVDDGPRNIEASTVMLCEAAEQGITDIVLTPHYCHGIFPFDRERIEKNMSLLLPQARQLGIRLYLGTEYRVNSSIVSYLQKGRCQTLADSPYVLTEYDFEAEYLYIRTMSQDLIFHGYIPILAHVERCACFLEEPQLLWELKSLGVLVQVNCDSVLGKEGFRTKRFCKKLIKNRCVDFIASDSHGTRKRVCNMQACYQYVEKKHGKECAQTLMVDNPYRVIVKGKQFTKYSFQK